MLTPQFKETKMTAQPKNVGELVEFLSKFPKEMKVVLSRDAEGNGFHPLAEVENVKYLSTSDWEGECFPIESEDPEDAAPLEAIDVLVLWPAG
jgi:hypothetical protein